MEMLRGYELVTEWKNSNCGKIVRGKRDGKTFFIKQYQTPVMPLNNGSLDERTFNQNKQVFEKFVSRRTRLNTALRAVAGAGGNIVIPVEEFIDGNHYMESSEFIEGVVPDDELETVLASLAPDVKKLLMLTAAGALGTIHSNGIIHSDLKLENVLLVRNAFSGNYVAKIIDFDSGYFTDDIPEEAVGDIRYFSPELAAYSDEEDDKESLKSTLTPKSDIFSLGIIFHRYLTGEFPQAVSLTERLQRRKDSGKPVYCWSILLNGCELQVSDAITEPHYRLLIMDMLEKDPAKRPTATEVLRRLKSPVTVTVEEPWPEHRIMVKKEKIVADGNLGLKKKEVSGRRVYELLDNKCRKQELTEEDLVARGYAEKAVEMGFDECYPEHGISWNEDKLRARGFVAAKRKEMAGVKGYNLYRADSTATFFTKEKLTMMGYAVSGARAAASSTSTSSTSTSAASTSTSTTSTATVTGFCAPWSEHNIEIDEGVARSKGYVGLQQETRAGVKGYLLFATSGEPRFVRAELLCMLKLAKRK